MTHKLSFFFNKPRLSFLFITFFCSIELLANTDVGQVIDLSKWPTLSTNSLGGTTRSGVVRLGKYELPAVLETTSKGNGDLLLKNIHLRVWDEHDDGAVYLGGWLTIEVSGNDTVFIYGILVLSDDADKKRENLVYRSLFGVYKYRPKSDTFTKVYGNANWSYAEMGR